MANIDQWRVAGPRAYVQVGPTAAVASAGSVTMALNEPAMFDAMLHEATSQRETALGPAVREIFGEAAAQQAQLFSNEDRTADSSIVLQDGATRSITVRGFLMSPGVSKGYMRAGAPKSFVQSVVRISGLQYGIYSIQGPYQPSATEAPTVYYPTARIESIPNLPQLWLDTLETTKLDDGQTIPMDRVEWWRNQVLAQFSTSTYGRLRYTMLKQVDENNTRGPDENEGGLAAGGSPLGVLRSLLKMSAENTLGELDFLRPIATADAGQKTQCADSIAKFIINTMAVTGGDFFAVMLSIAKAFLLDYVPPHDISYSYGYFRRTSDGILSTPVVRDISPILFNVSPGVKELIPVRQVAVEAPVGTFFSPNREQGVRLPAAIWPEVAAPNSRVMVITPPPWFPPNNVLTGENSASLGGTEDSEAFRTLTDYEASLLGIQADTDRRVGRFGSSTNPWDQVLREYARQAYLIAALGQSTAQVVLNLDLPQSSALDNPQRSWVIGTRYKLQLPDLTPLFTGQLVKVTHNLQLDDQSGAARTTLEFRFVTAADFQLPYRTNPITPGT